MTKFQIKMQSSSASITMTIEIRKFLAVSIMRASVASSLRCYTATELTAVCAADGRP